jgi:hypothetical protein
MRARLVRVRVACTKKIAHDTCHDDPYNVPSKFGEDPLRNEETYSRTDTHRNSLIYSKM